MESYLIKITIQYLSWTNNFKFKDFRFTLKDEARHSINTKKSNNFQLLKNAGWHFGYLGGLEKVQYKIRLAAHLD